MKFSPKCAVLHMLHAKWTGKVGHVMGGKRWPEGRPALLHRASWTFTSGAIVDFINTHTIICDKKSPFLASTLSAC